MTRRRPRVDRALHQIQRAARLRPCPVCAHPEREHAVEDGHRVCSRGEGMRTSCRVCAELWARLPVITAFEAFARALSTPPSARPPANPFVLS